MNGPPPWFLDSSNVPGLSYRRTEAIGCTNFLNVFQIMQDRMLARKGEVVMNTCGFENLAVLVKSINGVLDYCTSHFVKV